MPDPRIKKLAEVLVHYSLDLRSGDQFQLRTFPLAEELALAVFEEAVKAGAHVLPMIGLPGTDELFYKYASEGQLDFVSPVRKLVVESFDALLTIGAQHNTRALSGIDPARVARVQKASAPITKIYLERSASLDLRWCYTEFPTHASAQEAEMGLFEYQDFVYSAGLLDEPDPVATWKKEGERQRDLIAWLAQREEVQFRGENIDLRLSIKERRFKEADGKYNFPDGEIFTAPVEKSVDGWVRFGYPAIFGGQEVIDVELWFQNGRVEKEKAAKGLELLTKLLDSDQGARYLGEWGIGTNYGITRFTKNMLFDEKMGGTIHFAVGAGYPETGSENESGLHWDMLCDMSNSEIMVDGELFYKDGKTIV